MDLNQYLERMNTNTNVIWIHFYLEIPTFTYLSTDNHPKYEIPELIIELSGGKIVTHTLDCKILPTALAIISINYL